jgi:hypothetical protein
MKRNSPIPDGTPGVERIRRQCLLLFEQSVGWSFRVKGTPLIDVVTGVDHKLQMVKGKQYGDFHVDLCEITNEEAAQSN